MSVDITLTDYKGNIVNSGDKILMSMRSGRLIERIYLGNTDKSYIFTQYSFFKDPNRQTIQVPAYWDISRMITKRVDKDINIKEHNAILYTKAQYFNSQGILLLERDSKDISPNLKKICQRKWS